MYDPRDDTQRPIVVGEENFIFTEVVSADPKIAPPGILNGANLFALDPTIADDGEAVLNIRSVYDFDGGAILDIPTVADPALTAADMALVLELAQDALQLDPAAALDAEGTRDFALARGLRVVADPVENLVLGGEMPHGPAFSTGLACGHARIFSAAPDR